MTIVIVALLAIIIGMFVIAVINPNVGYINTERKVLNKYSAWEEDLQLREEEIKQKEKKYNTNTEE
jgi:lipopolysaccharide export LptBFGC system permease protein LptF